MEKLASNPAQGECLTESTAGPAKSIQAIDRASVHRICSGQVVLTLATAVKELVENGLDAGATNIEVRLKDHGSEQVEVVDNGSGVEESNFQALTLKHHTSKLQDFADLTSVDTFGFRGEALSSLCALSKLSITTRHQKSAVGHKLEYDHSGKMLQQAPCARQPGTTVSLQNLFSTLPVRHKEFSRTLKKEFAKMAQVLSAYCIITTGVRITCTNQVGKGKKNIVVNTGGNDAVKENITNVFGPKQVQSLLEFVQALPSQEASSEYSIKTPLADEQVFRLTGYVSSCEHGEGRSSTDRQFFFINHRPCDLLKVTRLVNEVYHQYNRHQYPFVVLDIDLQKESVDVNVTPDKRQIFIQHEKLLLATIKTSLIKMFEPKSCIVPLSQTHTAQHGQRGSLTSVFGKTSPRTSQLHTQTSCPQLPTGKKSLTSSLANLKRSFSSAFAKDQPVSASNVDSSDHKQRRLDSFVTKHTTCSPGRIPSSPSTPEIDKDQTPNTPELGVIYLSSRDAIDSPGLAQDSGVSVDGDSDVNYQGLAGPSTVGNNCSEEDNADQKNTSVDRLTLCQDDIVPGTMSTSSVDECVPNRPIRQSSNPFDSNDERTSSASTRTEEYVQDMISPDSALQEQTSDPIEDLEESVTHPAGDTPEDPLLTYTEFDTAGEEVNRKTCSVPLCMKSLRQRISTVNRNRREQHPEGFCRSFRAKINPEDSQTAENELKKEISKEMFAKMEILGQFNLGFIIAKLGADLFIIDQHATDEKYNFEMLQRDTVIQSQKLICAQNLELTAVNETVLMDNLEIFEKNGFKFSINEEAPPTQRIKLVSKPVSKNWEFGKEDIEELIFMLSDSPGVMCRPSRIRQMFASRSCRKAIMIGTALSKSEMRKLVNHMGDIEQPWNCPHGRPTMRHLINLEMLPS